MKLKLVIVVLLSMSSLLLAPVAVGAQPLQGFGAAADSARDDVCKGLETSGGAAGCADSGVSVQDVIKVALQILSYIAGIIAVIMVIVAGVKYTTSGGDSSSVASAKNTLIYAIVGIMVVVFSQAIVQFVLNKTK